MGDIKKQKKLFRRPKKPFESARIKEEGGIVKKYGLKNKREIWKADAKISTIRGQAKDLIGEPMEKQKVFFEKLDKLGLRVKDVADALALRKEDWLERRLQQIVFKKNFAKTIKEARQKIVHKNVLVDGKVVNIPSFVVTTDLESKISLKAPGARKEKIEVAEEKVEEKKNVEEKKE
jgi:small subunit ribosomal protein S4